MKVFILGAYGMLGHRLVMDLQQIEGMEVYASARKQYPDLQAQLGLSREALFDGLDAGNLSGFEQALEKVQPDFVLNCIGIVKQLTESEHPIPAIQINALFPHQVHEVCHRVGARLIHFSTDCVFSGKQGNYSEEDLSDAQDVYGRTKYLGEVNQPDALTLRTSILGPEIQRHTGLFDWILKNKGKRIKGFAKAIYSGFTTMEMVRMVAKIMLEKPELSGVYQAASDPISKYDLINLINSELELGLTVDRDEEFQCDRSMTGARLNKTLSYEPPQWQEMVKDLRIGRSAYTIYPDL